jgi:protein phosphatase-4 regulatory subunit 3
MGIHLGSSKTSIKSTKWVSLPNCKMVTPLTTAADQDQAASSPLNIPLSPPTTGSHAANGQHRPWQIPTLANIKDQEMWLRMQAKSAAGRERAVEHIIAEVSYTVLAVQKAYRQDYIKQLIGVFEQAEDLESLEDLHALCALMQTICKPASKKNVES